MKKTMKTFLALLMAGTMAAGFTSCGGTSGSASDSAGTSASASVSDSGTHSHAFGEWTVVKPATTEEEGMEKRVCACGEEETRKIPKVEKLPEVDATAPLNVSNVKLGVGGYEWGPAVDMLVFKVDGTVSQATLNAEMFTVQQVAQQGNTAIPVKDAFPCDENGVKTEGESEYFAVKFEAKSGRLSPFTYDFQTNSNSWATGEMTVSVGLNQGSKIAVTGDKQITNYSQFTYDKPINISDRVVPSTASFVKSSYKDEEKNITLTTAAYETAEMKADKGKNPLIIWLHGAGEGGTDVDIALLGNDVTNLTEEKIQSHFITDDVKGAYVLAVQTPTMWMNDGTGEYTKDGTSMYLETLMKTIKNYAEKENTDVDLNRIYIGGCSNGGYMTVNMLIHHGDYFAAAYPVCEAYTDSWITDEQVAALAKYNIWFTHSANDTTVNPVMHTNATYVRLLNAGAKSVYFSYFETVLGTDDPTAFAWGSQGNYMGHYSWVYTLQDQCVRVQSTGITAAADLKGSNKNGGGTYVVSVNDTPTTLWGWMAAQTKGKSVGSAALDTTLPEDTPTPEGYTKGTVSADRTYTRFEAEDSFFTEVDGAQNPITVEDNAAISGGKGVGYFSEAGKALTFKFKANAAASGVKFSVGCASASFNMAGQWGDEGWGCAVAMSVEEVMQSISITINGKPVTLTGDPLPAGTAMFNAWTVATLNATVDLKEGDNVVVITKNAAGGAVNFDYIDLFAVLA